MSYLSTHEIDSIIANTHTLRIQTLPSSQYCSQFGLLKCDSLPTQIQYIFYSFDNIKNSVVPQYNRNPLPVAFILNASVQKLTWWFKDNISSSPPIEPDIILLRFPKGREIYASKAYSVRSPLSTSSGINQIEPKA